MLARKAFASFKVGTKFNPSDDPTRDVELRKPVLAPRWLRPLLVPDPTPEFAVSPYRLHRGGAVREAFAGSAGLSRALRRSDLWVEAYPERSHYVAADDLDQPAVRALLHRDILSGLLRYIHFGAPCTS